MICVLNISSTIQQKRTNRIAFKFRSPLSDLNYIISWNSISIIFEYIE